MFRKKAKSSLVVCVADTHSNSTVGVNPPVVLLRNGDEWRGGEASQWVYACWLTFWNRIENLKKQHKADLYVVVNGDAVDDPYHPTSEVVSKDKATILKIGQRVFQRPRELADHFFMVGGTSAHTGIDFWMEELLAEMLEGERDEERNAWAWDYLEFQAEGVNFFFTHHSQTGGRLPWTEKGAIDRQAGILLNRRAARRSIIPDVACYAHRHYHGENGIDAFPRVFYCPPWQLTKTSYGARIGKAGEVRPIGGWIFLCQDGEMTPDLIKFQGEDKKPWTKS